MNEQEKEVEKLNGIQNIVKRDGCCFHIPTLFGYRRYGSVACLITFQGEHIDNTLKHSHPNTHTHTQTLIYSQVLQKSDEEFDWYDLLVIDFQRKIIHVCRCVWTSKTPTNDETLFIPHHLHTFCVIVTAYKHIQFTFGAISCVSWRITLSEARFTSNGRWNVKIHTKYPRTKHRTMHTKRSSNASTCGLTYFATFFDHFARSIQEGPSKCHVLLSVLGL